LAVETSDLAEWARSHEACFEVEPLRELVKGKVVQVGFTLNLYARLTLDEQTRSERWVQAAEIRAALHQIVESLAAPPESRARVEIQPPRSAVFVPPETGQPEVALSAHIVHDLDYFEEATESEEQRLHAVTRRLTQMGLWERLPRTV